MVEDTEPTDFVSSQDKLFLPQRNQPYEDVLSPDPTHPGFPWEGTSAVGGFVGSQEVQSAGEGGRK